MGVPGLTTFLSRLPGGRCKVNILDEIRNSESENPLIVIDLMSIVCSLSGPVDEQIYGCRNQFAWFNATIFCNNMISEGAKLAFFMNGRIQEGKYDSWIQKQEKVYVDSLKKMNNIPEINQINGNVTKHAFITALITVARKMGEFITTYEGDFDRFAVSYARDNKALAVITGDSDYLIYRGNWRLWSSSDLDLKTMSTYEWKKDVLKKELNLTWSQMPFFAVIAGNDYFKHRPLKMRTFYNVAHKVRTLRLKLGLTKISNEIYKKIFGRKNGNLKLAFENGVKMYDLKNTVLNPTLPSDIRHFPNYAICILCNVPSSIRLPCLDLRDAEYSKLALQLYRRQVGLLFYHRRTEADQPLTSQVFIKLNHYTPYKLHSVTPIYPPNDMLVPLPEELYALDKSPDEIRCKQVKLLCWLVSDTLTFVEICRIPWDYLLDVLTLYFLVENKLLDVPTADIILITIQNSVQNTIPPVLALEQPRKSNVQTSFLYVHFYAMIYFSAEIVGLCGQLDPFFHSKFDGVYFNSIADHLRSNPVIVESNMPDLSNLRRYSKFSSV